MTCVHPPAGGLGVVDLGFWLSLSFIDREQSPLPGKRDSGIIVDLAFLTDQHWL